MVAWLLALELLAVLGFPLAFALFRRLPDRGFTLAKPMCLVLFAYVFWLLGLTGLASNSRWTIAVILLAGAIAAGWLVRRRAGELRTFLRGHWRLLLAGELVFLVFLGLWLAIVSQAPEINHTEKPMDFAFLNSILRSPHFPPEDPWLAGHPISYYYFGHLMMAFLVKLTGVSSSVGYNLAVALVPALTAAASFGLVYNLVRLSGGSLVRALGFGLLAPLLVMLVGNLEGVLEFVHAQGWGSQRFWEWVGIKGLEAGRPANSTVFPQDMWSWWWRTTRVIDTLDQGQSLDYTITEFPFFSFLLGDLHAHMMSLPFLLLALSLLLNLFLREGGTGLAWLARGWRELAALALFLGALAFINTWDFPVLAAILGALVLLRSYRHRHSLAAETPPAMDGATRILGVALWDTAVGLLPVVAAAVLLFLPFYLGLDSQASGVLPVMGVSTRPLHFILVMGLPIILAVSFLLRSAFGGPVLSRPSLSDAPAAVLLLIVVLSPFLLWAALAFAFTFLAQGPEGALARVGGRLFLVLPGLTLAGAAGFSAFQRVRLDREPIAAFPLLFLAVAAYLLVGAELYRVVDDFNNRMNTVFKIYYQAWLLLAVAGAYGIYYWYAHRPQGTVYRVLHYAWSGIVALLVGVSLYYPVGATLERTGLLGSGASGTATLDGLAFVRRSDPAEYRAIGCLRDQAPWGRLVEAVGDDYSDHGRISASTGLPTILGWKGHELQWRGSGRLLAGREEGVARVYQSDDSGEVGLLLDRYQVRYVYFGARERARYGESHLGQFSGLLRTAFAQGDVVIYERVGVAGPLECQSE